MHITLNLSSKTSSRNDGCVCLAEGGKRNVKEEVGKKKERKGMLGMHRNRKWIGEE